LPIGILVVLAAARLLAGMSDLDGARVLDRVALGGGILWVILLICLVLAQGIQAIRYPNDDPRNPES